MSEAPAAPPAGIRFEPAAAINAAALSALFKASGIRRPSDDLPRLERMLHHADLCLTAWDGEQLVGVCRALSDFSYCCYLSDLAVATSHQRRGIGRHLLDLLQARLGPQVAIVLLAAPEAMAYYPALGFERLENAFIRRRQY